MSNRWIILTTLVLVLGAVWIWIGRAPLGGTTEAITLPRQGFTAPDFSLPTTNGESISLSELRGRPIIINLWASWCPPCRAEMPALQNVFEEYQDQGLVVLAVNATNQDSPSEAVDFAQAHNLTFPILLDVDGVVSRLYNLQSLPTTFFIDKKGEIQEVVIGGPMAEALLRVRVDQLLKGTP